MARRLRDIDAAALRAHVDREAIRAALADYFDVLGRGDWAAIAEGFTADAELDYGTPGVRDREGNLRLLRAGVERLTLVSTLMGMQARVQVLGDAATSQAIAFTAHLAAGEDPPRMRVSFVRYEDDWRRGADGRWRVRVRVVHPDVKGWLDPV
jgi:hypothetical protein